MGEENGWFCATCILLPFVAYGFRSAAAERADRFGRVRGWSAYLGLLLGWYVLGTTIAWALQLRSDLGGWLAAIGGGVVGLVVGWFAAGPVYRVLTGPPRTDEHSDTDGFQS